MNSARIFREFPGRGEPEVLHALVERLLEEQRKAWPDLARGLEALASIQVRTISSDHYATLVQYNPIRMTSTGAKVDPQSIAGRRCFLCVENLPEPQQGVLYRDEFFILCNPAPIFRGHYTVAHIEHRAQAIGGVMGLMLTLARDLHPSYAVFYNGPRCGASAPDHLHFQACPVGAIPAAERAFLEKHANGTVRVNETRIALLGNTDRSILAFRSRWASEAVLVTERILDTTAQLVGTAEEPLVNILVWWAEGEWQLVVILRSKHRPDAYFREDEGRLLVSPAAVDMGGLIITPREEDFRRLNAPMIGGIYREVSLDPDLARSILEGIA